LFRFEPFVKAGWRAKPPVASLDEERHGSEGLAAYLAVTCYGILSCLVGAASTAIQSVTRKVTTWRPVFSKLLPAVVTLLSDGRHNEIPLSQDAVSAQGSRAVDSDRLFVAAGQAATSSTANYTIQWGLGQR
jgi:hypothetical protein